MSEILENRTIRLSFFAKEVKYIVLVSVMVGTILFQYFILSDNSDG
ncbi:MAG: hypothetical protein LBL62_00535 [Planctomycetaceae bacterium]|nr:hypothetical protein [Planctomycetaceae bacterium]